MAQSAREIGEKAAVADHTDPSVGGIGFVCVAPAVGQAKALPAFARAVLTLLHALSAAPPAANGLDRARLADEVAKMTCEYVQRQLHNRRDFLMAEQAFRQEALLNPRLRELADAHQRILSLGAVHFFQVLGSGQPEQDAKVLTSIILQMEYQGLVDGVEQLAVDEMRAILRRYLNLVMGL